MDSFSLFSSSPLDVMKTKPKQYCTSAICFIPALSAHFEILDVELKCWPKGHWWSLQNFRTLHQVLQIIPSLSLMQHISWKKWQGKKSSKQFSLLNLFQSVLRCISHGYFLSTVTFLALRQTWFHQYKISWKPSHSIYKTIYKFTDKMPVPTGSPSSGALPRWGPLQVRKAADHWLWGCISLGSQRCWVIMVHKSGTDFRKRMKT